MTKEELAERLNGIEYVDICARNFFGDIKGSSLVVVWGASDDLMEFSGAILDEVGCYGGGKAYLDKNGLIHNECSSHDCPYFEDYKGKAQTITAVWAENDLMPAWTYETDIPHVTFDIWDEGERYCRGIIFDLAEVEVKQ